MTNFKSWIDFIRHQNKQTYFENLIKFVEEESKKSIIYPPRKDLFNAFKECPLSEIKIVILGQDPYHGPDQAHGLAFSVLEGAPIPPSLKNIFRELKSDLSLTDDDFKHGCLSQWSKQGVLLLNTVLTVKKDNPGSHRNMGWETFTDEAIKVINKLDRPIVFILWGLVAQDKKKLINNPKHCILRSAHPSPLSAHNGFFGSKHFSLANDFLINNNITPIDWRIK